MSDARPSAVIILAAGEGTRMRSALPKVMHPIGGRSLVGHAIAAARATGTEHVAVVVRHERDRVAEHVTAIDASCTIADQDEIKGTGRATECGLDALPTDLSGTVLVTMGDVPLLQGETLVALAEEHASSGSAVTVITSVLPDAKAYGRIVRAADGSVERIVEFKDATDAQREIREINSGIYAFDAELLRTRHGIELAELAEKRGVALNFEAAAAGAIPIVKTLREGLAGNSVQRVYGILNGTCNYMLTRMEREKLSFDECLKEAQRLGYAEADPSFDIEGHDTAQKLAILASLTFGTRVDPEAIYVEGITSITTADLEAADHDRQNAVGGAHGAAAHRGVEKQQPVRASGLLQRGRRCRFKAAAARAGLW
mgnify:CR=1 FL=1